MAAKTTIKSAEDFGAAIATAANSVGKVTILRIAIPGAAGSVKVATDRARRIPRLQGLRAVSVSVRSFDKGVCELELSTDSATAAPWPTKVAPAPAKAAAKRSTRKAPAKAAAKSTARKAPAKSTTAKRSTRKAAAK